MLKSVGSVIKYWGVLSLLLIFSCTKEDLSECDYYLEFRYDYNLASLDWFSEQVEEVKVYLFDAEGGYVQTITETTPTISLSGYKMKVPYEAKGYSAVVWAGRTGSYELPIMNVGDSKDKLKLIYTPLDMKSDKQIDNLWHSGPTTLLFPDDGETTQTISLVRNTNDINIKLFNSEGVSIIANHHIKIRTANGSYDYKNSFLSDNQPIGYTPHTNDGLEAQLRTLRLVEGDNIILSVTDNNGKPIGINGQTEINLIEYLLLSKPSGMANQEYLDRCYIWNISFTVRDYLALNIIVNNWVVWFDNTEI